MANLLSTNCWANNILLKKDNNIKLEITEEKEEEESFIPNSNRKLKFMKTTSNHPPDKYLIELLNRLKESRQEQKKEKFDRWLNKRANGYKIKFILTELLEDIHKKIKNNGYAITDENQLKNEMATFIYQQSENAFHKEKRCI
jgi:hypothetical protein